MERTLWQDNNFPYYLVTLAPWDQERGSTGGTALTNAFMMDLSRQGVRPDSEAFKAGLRDGQQVIGMSIYWNDPLKPAKLTIRTAEGNQTFVYYPHGSESAVPQYHLDTDAYAANPGKCGLPLKAR